jgi:hypothetical protein
MGLRDRKEAPTEPGLQVIITFQRGPTRHWVGQLTMRAFADPVIRFFGRSTNRPGSRPPERERPELLSAVVHDDECQPTWATRCWASVSPGTKHEGGLILDWVLERECDVYLVRARCKHARKSWNETHKVQASNGWLIRWPLAES